MNWEAVGAIGETIGAIAVLVTLAYIAIQVRATNRLILMQHRETNRAAQYQVDQLELQDRSFAELLYRAETEYHNLDEIDSRRVLKHVRNELIHRQNMYIRGKLLKDTRVTTIATIAGRTVIERYPFVEQMLLSEGWDTEFRNEILERPSAAG